FDFSGLTISTSGYTNGFNVSGSWIHLKGIEVANVPMNMYSNNGISVNNAHDDIFESLNLHHNSGTGIFINAGTGGHLVLNSDAHDNYDPNSNQGNGQNADGFGVHYQTTGNRTIIRGCRAWWNSDDGYDLINHEVSVTVEYSWAMGNGYANYGTTNPPDGNGNGFKMGSSKTGVRHLVQGNVAWKNKASGFYANHSTGGNTWYNNTSFQNGTQYNMLASPADMPDVTITLTGTLAHIMRNNIGFPNRNSNMTGVDTMFNSWDSSSLAPANGDFASVTDPSAPTNGQAMGMSIESSGALGPRAPDGTMPRVDFLKLAMGSKMIDKGTDVGLPFVGAAPDLGAYEFGAASTTGTGGTSGGAGTTGAGGATGAAGRGGTSGGAGTTGSGGRGGTSGAAGPGTGGTGVSTTGTAGTGVSTTGAAGDALPAGTGGASATGTAGAGGAGPGENAAGGCACAIDAASGRASLFGLAVFGAVSSVLLRR